MLTTKEIWDLVEDYVEYTGRYPTCDICHKRIPSDLTGWAVSLSQEGVITLLCPDCKEVELNV